MESMRMSEDSARQLMKILRDGGSTPDTPIELARVQVWAENNGFADLLEEAIASASDLAWIEDDGDPANGQMKITSTGWDQGLDRPDLV
jgi:hypothetical protein